jgi:hypothetical protein
MGQFCPMPHHVFTKRIYMKFRVFYFIVLIAAGLAGCDTIATYTNMLSDEKIKSSAAGALGYAPKDMIIVDRRTEGTNTYVQLKTTAGNEFNCIINGGNLLTMGMVNPPMCAKKGQAIQANPFSR